MKNITISFPNDSEYALWQTGYTYALFIYSNFKSRNRNSVSLKSLNLILPVVPDIFLTCFLCNHKHNCFLFISKQDIVLRHKGQLNDLWGLECPISLKTKLLYRSTLLKKRSVSKFWLDTFGKWMCLREGLLILQSLDSWKGHQNF